jgi:hypothetical protein
MKSEEWRKTSWHGKPMDGSTGADSDRALFEELEIYPRTTPGTSAVWFCTRGYSCGSSTSDALLNVVKKHPQSSPEDHDNEDDIMIINAAQPILSYIGENSANTILVEEVEVNQPEEEGDDANPEIIGGQETTNGTEEEEEQPAANNAPGDDDEEVPNMNYEYGSIEHVKFTLRQILKKPTDTELVSVLKFQIHPVQETDEDPLEPIADEVRKMESYFSKDVFVLTNTMKSNKSYLPLCF